MPEQLFFSDSEVPITLADATFGRIRLPISDITAARIESVWPKRHIFLAVVWIIVGLNLLLTVLRWFVIPQGSALYAATTPTRDLLLLLTAISLFIWGYSARHAVKVTGSFGEKDVVIARNYSYARKVVEALEAAQKAASASGALPVSG